MSKITLFDVLTKSPNEIIQQANLQQSDFILEYKQNRYIPIKDYYNLLEEDKLVVGYKFLLKNGVYAEIVDIIKSKNKVVIRISNNNNRIFTLNLYKLLKNSIEKKNFNYNIGDTFLYKKGKEKITIEIKYLNPSQNAIAYLDETGKKILVRVSKLEKINRR